MQKFNLSFPIQAGEIRIEQLQEKNIESFLPFFQNSEDTRYYYADKEHHLDLAGLKELMQEWHDGEKYFVLEIYHQKKLIGILTVDDVDLVNQKCEIGIAIFSKADRRKGLAKKAISLLVDKLFAEVKLHRIWVKVISGNEKSLALFQDLDFQLEGVLREAIFRAGEFRDLYILARLAAK